MGNLIKMYNIRKYLMEEARKMLLVGLVLSHLVYVNAILVGLLECNINKMQRIKNIAAKLAMKVRKYNSTTTALRKLHWLPIRVRIDHKLLCLQGIALEYLKVLLLDKPRRDPTVSTNAYMYPGLQGKCWQLDLSVSRDLNSRMRSQPTSGNKRCWILLNVTLKHIFSISTLRIKLCTALPKPNG